MIDSLQRNGEKDHDGDSDFVRVRVRVFPRTGSLQFIDGQRVDEAVARPLVEDSTAPLIMGVDIARQGADQSVIRFRRGLDAHSIPGGPHRGQRRRGALRQQARRDVGLPEGVVQGRLPARRQRAFSRPEGGRATNRHQPPNVPGDSVHTLPLTST